MKIMLIRGGGGDNEDDDVDHDDDADDDDDDLSLLASHTGQTGEMLYMKKNGNQQAMKDPMIRPTKVMLMVIMIKMMIMMVMIITIMMVMAIRDIMVRPSNIIKNWLT